MTCQLPRPISDAYLKELQEKQEKQGANEADWDGKEEIPGENGTPKAVVVSEPEQMPDQLMEDAPANSDIPFTSPAGKDTGILNVDNAASDVPMRAVERKRLHWEGKLCEWKFCFL